MELIGSTGIMQKQAWNPMDAWHSLTGGDAWNTMWNGRADTMQQLSERAKQEGDNGGSASAMLGSINEYKNSPHSGIADAWHSLGADDASLKRMKEYADSGNTASKERYDSVMRWRNNAHDVGARLNMNDELGGSTPKGLAENKQLLKYMAPNGEAASTPAAPVENFKPPVVAPTPASPVTPTPTVAQTPATSVAAPGQSLTPQQTATNAARAQGINPTTNLPMGWDPRDGDEAPISTAPEDVQRRMARSRQMVMGNPTAQLKKTACVNLSFSLLGI